MSSSGILYFLVNDSMPGLIKIGHTNGTLDDRLKQLNTTGTPSPFKVAALFFVRDSAACEKTVHEKLALYRTNPKREFFAESVATLVSKSIEVIDNDLDSSPSTIKPVEEVFQPDKDSIYFMTFLLHDAYEQNCPISTAQLAEYHLGYAPLELEVKLIELLQHGYLVRSNRGNGLVADSS